MNICVFSSSSNAINEIYFEEARQLGRIIGEEGHILINGGAKVGLMEEVTVSARNAGARTIGIIPKRLKEKDLISLNTTDVIVTRDMQDRKAKMREISDAFIALPGGFGTLEEILEVITLRQLSYHTKPIIFINTNNFFLNLFKHFEVSYKEMFSKENYRQLYFVAETAKEAINYLKKYVPTELDTKWFIVPNK